MLARTTEHRLYGIALSASAMKNVRNTSKCGPGPRAGSGASLAWAVAFEINNDVGYAIFLPVGLALYARSAPRSVGGMVTGLYYVLLFFTNMLIGWLGGFLERMSGAQFWMLYVAVGNAALVLCPTRRSCGAEGWATDMHELTAIALRT